jgi:polyhydroxyalkanoate synthesis regulator phasin
MLHVGCGGKVEKRRRGYACTCGLRSAFLEDFNYDLGSRMEEEFEIAKAKPLEVKEVSNQAFVKGLKMSKKEAKAISFDPDDIIRRKEEFLAEIAEQEQAALADILDQIEALKVKARKLGWLDPEVTGQTSKPRKTSETSDGEKQQRACKRCGKLGERSDKCTANLDKVLPSWWELPKGKEEFASLSHEDKAKVETKAAKA